MTNLSNVDILLSPDGTPKGVAKDEHIYQAILEAVVEHRLTPGARLPEDSLSEVFGVSRTVIRKVLQRLALERLVSIKPNRGAQVAQPSVKEAHDVFSARTLIEPAMMEDVCRRISQQKVQQLMRVVHAEHQAQEEGNLSDAIRLSARFHVQLLAVAGNDVITEQIAILTTRSSLIIAVYGNRHSVGCECGDHADLIKIVGEGNGESASAWMRHHLTQIHHSLDFEIGSTGTPDFHAIFRKQ